MDDKEKTLVALDNMVMLACMEKTMGTIAPLIAIEDVLIKTLSISNDREAGPCVTIDHGDLSQDSQSNVYKFLITLAEESLAFAKEMVQAEAPIKTKVNVSTNQTIFGFTRK